jgi:hypothetical protein
MDAPPWTSTEFLPLLVTIIQARALQHILGGTFNFDWQELGPGSVYLGDPVYANHQVLQDRDPADVPAHKKVFEDFFRRAESLPETADMQSKWDRRGSAAKAAIQLLATVANTDPITGRCLLCRGSDYAAWSPGGDASEVPGVPEASRTPHS